MKAVITVSGKDKVGIIAAVSGWLLELGLNIEDISQTVMHGFFSMMMLVDVTNVTDFDRVACFLEEKGKSIDVVIHVQHEDIFNTMHRI